MPSVLAECRSFPPSPTVKTGHTGWLWFADAILYYNSQAESHFKSTRRVIDELLKVNTANWLAFPPQIQGLQQIQYFHIKKKRGL